MSDVFAHSCEPVYEPIPIALIAGRYLLFDVDVVDYLRRTYHICGTFIGAIPEVPQQNTFQGLPLQLMVEEAKFLVEKEAAYIVDDAAWHNDNFSLEGEDKQAYLDNIRTVGLERRKMGADAAREKTKVALADVETDKIAARKLQRAEKKLKALTETQLQEQAHTLFGQRKPSHSISAANSMSSNASWGVTPTISYSSSSCPLPQGPEPPAVSSYHLFSHLHDHDYYMMPGLRFGCNFNVYPGDPSRFHAHFSAVSYEWNEEIPMLDIIGGGRLGTRVKKAHLIGGKVEDDEPRGKNTTRTFTIEWGGM